MTRHEDYENMNVNVWASEPQSQRQMYVVDIHMGLPDSNVGRTDFFLVSVNTFVSLENS